MRCMHSPLAALFIMISVDNVQELNMRRFLSGPLMATAIVGAFVLASPAIAKTAKDCRAEWTANKAANQAKGVTEKAYIEQCRAADEKPKAAKDVKEKTTAKKKTTAQEKATAKTAAPATGDKKTAKECQDEWRANKAANQSKGITEKAYVEDCRSGKTAMTPPAAAPMTKTKPAQTKMAPQKAEPEKSTAAPSNAKPTAPVAAAPASGKPEGANQFTTESQAKSHCPSGLVVWANLNSKIYHFSGHSDYGHTKQGAYMCEKDAEAQGIRAAKNEKHP